MADAAPLPRARRGTDLVGVVFVLAAVGVAGFALRERLPEVGAALADLRWWEQAGALLAVVAGLLATAEVWKHSLGALGHPVRSSVARRIFFPAQVGKYLPGAVWPFLAQVRLARQHGVPAPSALLGGTMFLAVHAVTAVVAAAALLALQPEVAERFGWAWLVAPLALPLLHPRVVTFLVRRIGRFPDPAQAPRLGWSDLVRPLAWMAPAWLGYGAGAAVLAGPFTQTSWVALWALCTSAFALSWLIGVAVFVAPAGVGAREAVLVLVLSPVVGVAAAASVSLVLRACHTVADILLALAYGVGRTNRRPSHHRIG